MIYKYKGIDSSGKKVQAKVEAVSLDEAKNKLRIKDILYESIKEDSSTFYNGLNLSIKYKIPSNELATLSRELAMYIHSGVTIVSALKIIQTHYENNKKMKLFLTTVSTHLNEGNNFYSALDSQSIVELPEFYKQSIKVSESGGILDEVLMELSRFLKEQDKLNKEIKQAFAYPTFMIVISIIMVSLMLALVVPQITGIFENMDQELPMPTQIVIAMSDFFNNNLTTILVSIFSSLSLFILLRKKNKHFSYAVDKLILRLPFFGSMVQKSELARFSYVASLLTRSGVVFVETINLSTNILNNSVLKKVFMDASAKVVEGELLSNAINNSNIKINYTFIQSIALGEETSQIENILTNISELYFEENRDKTKMLLTLLEPSLMLFVGASIGFIVAAMLLPIFSMSIA